jgi:hypothetical protein
MFKNKICNLLIITSIILLTFACGKKEDNETVNSDINPDVNPTPTPISLATETPLPEEKTISKPITSSPQKTDQDILNLIYGKENEIKLCDGQLDRDVSSQSSSVYALNKEDYLVEILCFMGAYQGNYEYILYQNNGSQLTIKPLLFKSFSPDKQGKYNSNMVRSISGIPNYNSHQKVLNLYTKDRGLGDCGSTAQYKWKNNDFELVEYKAKSECDGNAIEPENYPVIYTNKKSEQSKNQPSETISINVILNKRKELSLCEDHFEQNSIMEFSNIYTINNEEKLIEIVCYTGAYQSVYQYFIFNPKDIQPLHLTQFSKNESGNVIETQEMLISGIANYDQNQQILSIFNKYAGHGGCGTMAKYQWQEITFELLEYRANFDCNNPIPADKWAIVNS